MKNIKLFTVVLGLWAYSIALAFSVRLVYQHYIHYTLGWSWLFLSLLLLTCMYKPQIGSKEFHTKRVLQVVLAVSSLAVWLTFPTPSNETYLGSEPVIFGAPKQELHITSGNSVRGFGLKANSADNFFYRKYDLNKFSIEEIKSMGYNYVILFNPNCTTCQDTLPKLKKAVGERSNILYIDVTTKSGSYFANKLVNGQVKVPSAIYVESNEYVRLGYHSKSGTQIFSSNLDKLILDIKS